MVLELLKNQVEIYKAFQQNPNYDEIYKWVSLKNFTETWDVDAENFREMFNKSFDDKISSNLWSGAHWFPKNVMLKFIDYKPEHVRQMFKNLYDENENLETRIFNFENDCDILRNEIFENVDKSVKSHFHDGQRIISTYLAFRFPEKYAIYKYTEFKTFMNLVRAKDIPGTGEIERFFKVVRVLYNILRSDKELLQIHNGLLDNDCYQNDTLMIAQDVIFITARLHLMKN